MSKSPQRVGEIRANMTLARSAIAHAAEKAIVPLGSDVLKALDMELATAAEYCNAARRIIAGVTPMTPEQVAEYRQAQASAVSKATATRKAAPQQQRGH